MNAEAQLLYGNDSINETRDQMIVLKDASSVAEDILSVCGGWKILDIGSGAGELVQSFLSLGIDAYGVDSSHSVVAACNKRMPDRFMQATMQYLPFGDQSFDTVVATYSLEYLSKDELDIALKEIRRVTRRSVYFRISTARPADNMTMPVTLQDRHTWETCFFGAGFRKHPAYYQVNSYESLGHEGKEITVLLECIPQAALESYPLEALQEERDLHMDMTRETGERSDAHIARYQWAATFVRPGDFVLDAACGLGYGSYLVQCGTRAAKTLGIDGSGYAIDYARPNFASMVRGLDFAEGMLPEALKDIANNSVDLIISFETLEHVADPQGLLAEFHRVLTPAGRIIVSVPNDWSDETGEDPNPFHLHVYTLDKLRNQIEARYILEQLVAQSATRYKEGPEYKHWAPAKRELYSVSNVVASQTAPNAEWWLAVGMRSPLDGEQVPFRDSQFRTFDNDKWHVTAFGRDYENPWLVRGMVDIGHRIKDKKALQMLAEEVHSRTEVSSSDTGAALCVWGYQLLEAKHTISYDEIVNYAAQVENYVKNDSLSAHMFRWKVSLHFLLGKLLLASGKENEAQSSFEACVSLDPLRFSPLLANRTVESWLLLGVIALGRGDEYRAQHCWREGIWTAQRVLTVDWNTALGDINNPVEFGLPELSSLLDYASTCAYALVNVKDVGQKPWWWSNLQRSRNSQAAILEKKVNTIHPLNEEISRLNLVLKEKEKTITELCSVLNVKEKAVTELSQRLNTPHLVRLMTVTEQPWSIRKIFQTIYFIASQSLPPWLHRKLFPIVMRFRAFRARRSAIDMKAEKSNPNGYKVILPEAKADAPHVVHVIANFMMGGSSRLVVDLIEHLGADYKQSVFTSLIPVPPAYIGVDVEECRFPEDCEPFVNYFKRVNADFVHVHYWGDVDKPWYSKAMEAARLLDIPVIENINTPVAPYMSEAVKRYVYVSDYVRHVYGQNNDKHVTVYPGSDFSHFTRTSDEPVPKDCVGMVYRLEEDKLNINAIQPFIRIVQKRPQTKILIVGGGSLLEPFQQAVRDAGVEGNFEFTGYVAYDELPGYYSRMSMFVAPVWKESFGQVSAFAMNMRVPVIGYDVGAIGEIVNSKALLAPAGDADRLANVAVALLDDVDALEKVGREHQSRAEKKFSVRAMIYAYKHLYAELIKETK